MGVYIKGMEMPTSCAKCKLFGEYGCPFIGAVGYALTEGRRSEDCPLVPVPPHGRLIEDCAVKNKIANQYLDNEFARGWNAAMKQCYETVEDAPTIIPAEEVE